MPFVPCARVVTRMLRLGTRRLDDSGLSAQSFRMILRAAFLISALTPMLFAQECYSVLLPGMICHTMSNLLFREETLQTKSGMLSDW